MAGAYRMALSGAEVVVTDPGGGVQPFPRVSVSVRDGIARMKQSGGQLLSEMEAADLAGRGRNWTITGLDGTTWSVSKPCGCGGSR